LKEQRAVKGAFRKDPREGGKVKRNLYAVNHNYFVSSETEKIKTKHNKGRRKIERSNSFLRKKWSGGSRTAVSKVPTELRGDATIAFKRSVFLQMFGGKVEKKGKGGFSRDSSLSRLPKTWRR